MKKIKNRRQARITFETSDEMKQLVDIKCAEEGITIKEVGIDLFYRWTQGRIK